MKHIYKQSILLFLCFFAFNINSFSQFREKAFRQSYADTTNMAEADTTESLFSFKDYFAGLSHKRDCDLGTLFTGSSVFIGGMQIYNKHYWKLPIIYGGIGANIACGIYFQKTKPQLSNYLYAGAAFIYWASFMDGVVSYKTEQKHSPSKATLYSLLLPGLGQAYNKEYWKIPIYVGGLVGTAHFWHLNQLNYMRFKNIHKAALGKDYKGPISAENALYYRNQYRRLRDYSILSFFAVYLLQIIDANVFAYMLDFDVSNNISLKVEPTIINQESQYAFLRTQDSMALGLKLGISF